MAHWRAGTERKEEEGEEGATHLVIPRTRAARERTLVPGVHVDQHARVARQVVRALAVAAATEARERDAVARQPAVQVRVRGARGAARRGEGGERGEREGERCREHGAWAWRGGEVGG